MLWIGIRGAVMREEQFLGSGMKRAGRGSEEEWTKKSNDAE